MGKFVCLKFGDRVQNLRRLTWRLGWTIPSQCLWLRNGTDIKEAVVGEVESQTKDPTAGKRETISIPSLVTSPRQGTRSPYQKEDVFNSEPLSSTASFHIVFL